MKVRYRWVVGVATLALGAAAAVAVAPAAASGDGAAVVATDRGSVRGTVAADHRTFEGVPYAAPPVGRLRWQPPRPAASWHGVRDATEVGSACPQPGGFPGDAASSDEDCLYLNVTTPRTTEKHLPVMVWLHGGGFYEGSGGEYDATRMAVRGGVVVVTLNYRLGALGFLDNPALSADTGDFGLQDQQAAERWVRRNIAAFGGDPRNVTLFGESAGGVSVCSQLTSPASAGLFERAIIQSGPCELNWPFDPKWSPVDGTTAAAYGTTVAKQLGCDDPATLAACLRATSAQDLVKLDDEDAFSPAYGTRTLPDKPSEVVASGRFPHVPVMVGTTRDEYVTFETQIEEYFGHLTDEQYRQQVADTFGADNAAAVEARYPLSGYAKPGQAWSAVVTDWGLACPTLEEDDALAAHTTTYGFEFADERAPWFAGQDRPDFPTGAAHASELQYLFDGAYSSGSLDSSQQDLARDMVGYWTRFARTGNPNGGTAPHWSAYHQGSGTVQALAPGSTGIRPVSLGQEHQCGFWKSLPAA